MKEIIKRFKSSTPKFWKKVRAVCLSAGSTATAIYGYTYFGQLPPIATEVAKICALLGFFGVFLSQLTTTDQNLSNGQDNQ